MWLRPSQSNRVPHAEKRCRQHEHRLQSRQAQKRAQLLVANGSGPMLWPWRPEPNGHIRGPWVLHSLRLGQGLPEFIRSDDDSKSFPMPCRSGRPCGVNPARVLLDGRMKIALHEYTPAEIQDAEWVATTRQAEISVTQ